MSIYLGYIVKLVILLIQDMLIFNKV